MFVCLFLLHVGQRGTSKRFCKLKGSTDHYTRKGVLVKPRCLWVPPDSCSLPLCPAHLSDCRPCSPKADSAPFSPAQSSAAGPQSDSCTEGPPSHRFLWELPFGDPTDGAGLGCSSDLPASSNLPPHASAFGGPASDILRSSDCTSSAAPTFV